MAVFLFCCVSLEVILGAFVGIKGKDWLEEKGIIDSGNSDNEIASDGV